MFLRGEAKSCKISSSPLKSSYNVQFHLYSNPFFSSSPSTYTFLRCLIRSLWAFTGGARVDLVSWKRWAIVFDFIGALFAVTGWIAVLLWATSFNCFLRSLCKLAAENPALMTKHRTSCWPLEHFPSQSLGTFCFSKPAFRFYIPSSQPSQVLPSHSASISWILHSSLLNLFLFPCPNSLLELDPVHLHYRLASFET